MTFELEPLDPGFTPAYVQIADQIRAAIRSGELAPGDPLPSQDALASSAGVARMTVNQALSLLKREALIVSQRGKGTTVLEPHTWPIQPSEQVVPYLSSSTPGTLRTFNLSPDEIQGITLPGYNPDGLFLENAARPFNLLLEPGCDLDRLALLLDSRVSTFEIRLLAEPTDVPSFVHMDGGETFMRLGRDGNCVDQERSLHFTINPGEGDPLLAWFESRWAVARKVSVAHGIVQA